MSTELIQIEVREDGSRVVSRDLEGVARSIEVVNSSLSLMKSALHSMQGTLKKPSEELNQIRSTLQALQAVTRAPNALFDPKVVEFASASLRRLRDVTEEFARTAPANIQAALGRVGIGIAGLEGQIQKAIRAQQALNDAQKASVAITKPQPQQMGFEFTKQPMTLAGQGWQLEGQFKSVATNAKDAAGTIASLAAPTQQFATAAKAAGTSTQQLNLNLGEANQTSFAFMNGMKAQTAPVNELAKQYSTVGEVWTKNKKEAEQLSFGFAKAAGGMKELGSKSGEASVSVEDLSKKLFNLRNALFVVANYLFLRELKDYIDTWIGIENSIRLSTKSVDEAAAVQQKLFEVAQRTRTPMEDLVRLYRRLAQVGGAIGATQQQMIDVSEGVGMALAVQGSSSTQARGALLQLGQAFGMARVRAQEFNSINENAPRILLAIAQNVPEAAGNIEKLRQIMLKGGLSGRQFFEAFRKALPGLKKEFADVRPTIGSAFDTLDTAIGKFIYDTDKASSASTMFANSILWLASHIKGVSLALIALTAGAILVFWPVLAAGVAKVTAAFWSMNAAIAANPIGLFIAAIAVAGAALAIFKDDIVISAETGATLGDYMRAVWSGLGRWIDKARVALNSFIEAYNSINMDGPANSAGSAFLQIVKRWVDGNKILINGQIGTLVFFAEAAKIIFDNIGTIIQAAFIGILNNMLEDIQTWVNRVLFGINIIRLLLGQPIIPPVDFKPIVTGATKAGEDVKAKLRQSFAEALSKDYVGSLLDAVSAQANRYAMDRTLKSGAGADLNKPLGQGTGKLDGTKDKLAKELETVRGQIDPTTEAIVKLMNAENVLIRAEAAGLITLKERERLMGLAEDKYLDLIDPLAAINREIEQEKRLLGLTNYERQAEDKLLKISQELKKKNVTLSDEETQKLRGKLVAQYAGLHVAKLADEMEKGLHENKRRLIEGEAALGLLYSKNRITLYEYNVEMAKLRVNAQMGSFSDGFIAQWDKMAGKVKNFAQESGAILADFTNSFVDGFSKAIAQSIVEWQDFKKLFYDLSKRVLTELIAAFIKLGIQMAINSQMGNSLQLAAAATSAATAAGVAEAWAPAAAAVSLASWGQNAGPAMLGISSTYGLARGLSAVGGGGFAKGGYTGDGATSDFAGFVHKREFVVNAAATAGNRALLEAINAGLVNSQSSSTVSNFVQGRESAADLASRTSDRTQQDDSRGGYGPLNIIVENHVGAEFDVERLSATDVKIIARREARDEIHRTTPGLVASQVSDPNSRISRSLSEYTNAKRQR